MLVTVGALGWACGAWERRLVWALAGPGDARARPGPQARPGPPREPLHRARRPGGRRCSPGSWSGWCAPGSERARRAAGAREAELGAASAAAVLAERLTVARELHDLVSGAVGVVVMQAGAAEVLLATDRAAARRALDVVLTTCAHTLEELDRFLAAKDGSPGSAGHDLADLRGLVDRMRLAGLDVDLTMVGDAAAAMPTVYRVVQESLLNTLRHAPGARAAVEIAVAGGAGTGRRRRRRAGTRHRRPARIRARRPRRAGPVRRRRRSPSGRARRAPASGWRPSCPCRTGTRLPIAPAPAGGLRRHRGRCRASGRRGRWRHDRARTAGGRPRPAAAGARRDPRDRPGPGGGGRSARTGRAPCAAPARWSRTWCSWTSRCRAGTA